MTGKISEVRKYLVSEPFCIRRSFGSEYYIAILVISYLDFY
jgi:hypothetical protein